MEKQLNSSKKSFKIKNIIVYATITWALLRIRLILIIILVWVQIQEIEIRTYLAATPNTSPKSVEVYP